MLRLKTKILVSTKVEINIGRVFTLSVTLVTLVTTIPGSRLNHTGPYSYHPATVVPSPHLAPKTFKQPVCLNFKINRPLPANIQLTNILLKNNMTRIEHFLTEYHSFNPFIIIYPHNHLTGLIFLIMVFKIHTPFITIYHP